MTSVSQVNPLVKALLNSCNATSSVSDMLVDAQKLEDVLADAPSEAALRGDAVVRHESIGGLHALSSALDTVRVVDETEE
jgi:hypothetical protein